MMCVSCSKCVLILFNILTGIIGAALLALGLIVRLGQDKLEWINEKIIPLLQRVILGGSSNIDFASLLETLTLAAIIIGSILLGISLMGLLGACCESECLLIMYAILVGIVILAQAACIGFFFVYKDKLVVILGSNLKETIETSYAGTSDGLDGGNQITAAWDSMQREFQCCGATGYTDYQGAAAWVKKEPGMKVPASCCQPGKSGCVVNPTPSTVNSKNCVDALMEFLKKHDLIIALVLGSVIAIETVLLGMSCAIACQGRGKK